MRLQLNSCLTALVPCMIVIGNCFASDSLEADHAEIKLNGNYWQFADATLSLAINGMSQPSFQVGGEATLAGTLRVTAGKGFTASTGGIPTKS